MTDSFSLPAPALNQAALRRRIGWMCHLIRLAAAAYAMWILFQVVTHWTNPASVTRGYGAWLKTDLSGMMPWQLMAGFAVHLGIWCFAAAACYSVWKLFSGYLAGRIFTLDATLWLRRIGIFGLTAQALDLVTRPLIAIIVSAHLPDGFRTVAFFGNPMDLLIVLFLGGFIALAEIFRAAAEIAADHEQIV
jgi:hypothetical protein